MLSARGKDYNLILIVRKKAFRGVLEQTVSMCCSTHFYHYCSNSFICSLKVAKLLLAKLGDYILPSAESDSVSVSEEDISTKSGEKHQDGESNDGQDDVVSVNVHLQENQQAHEVVQKIFRFVPSKETC